MSKLLTALCLLLSLIPSASVSAAESFGRLFTTPPERSSLDYLRQTTKAPRLEESSLTTLEAPPPASVIPDSISMQGYVKRSDGQKGTVWVNNHPLQEGSANGEVEVGKLGGNGNQVQLKLPASGKNFNLKVGQSYSSESDSVSESSRATTIKPSRESGTIDGSLNSQSPINSLDKPAH